jgi:hypothetical protein
MRMISFLGQVSRVEFTDTWQRSLSNSKTSQLTR